jgi:hypothetical protein
MANDAGLSAGLEVAQPVVAGLAALAILRIVNESPAPVLVSARLNLMEGDVSLTLTDPGGGLREIKGWQADTGLHRVELPPGHGLVGAIDLLDAPDGPIFPAPGEYRLGAEYRPSPQAPPAVAPPVPVSVVAPRTASERELAALLQDPSVRRALVLGDRDSAPERLRDIARRFPDTLEGRLAELVAGATDWDATEDRSGPIRLALAILALTNPYSRTGERLAEDYAARLEARRASADASPEIEQALHLLRAEPLAAGSLP